MISNCIFTWGFTSSLSVGVVNIVLWIDFKLYFYVRIHKYSLQYYGAFWVVNWFQIVFLREDSQARQKKQQNVKRCELISICIFTWGFTSPKNIATQRSVLWIDFNLYFYVRIHKGSHLNSTETIVVNWFQFVFLREDSQGLTWMMKMSVCCELISICIFTWGFTSSVSTYLCVVLLWIDFNLYFYVRIHKNVIEKYKALNVVNWFQFVFLREDSQAKNDYLK